MALAQGGSVPRDGVEFELTLQPASALKMADSDGYNISGWKFRGQELNVPRTGRFKLLRVSNYSDLSKIREELTAPGQKPAEGLARVAFNEAFPQNDHGGPIGFPDSSWEDALGGARFPVLLGNARHLWRPLFSLATCVSFDDWRWLVEVEEIK